MWFVYPGQVYLYRQATAVYRKLAANEVPGNSSPLRLAYSYPGVLRPVARITDNSQKFLGLPEIGGILTQSHYQLFPFWCVAFRRKPSRLLRPFFLV